MKAKGKVQAESVFRLRNFNIVEFFYIYFTAPHVSVLGPSSSTHIFHGRMTETCCGNNIGRGGGELLR
jgi:hypothetical protein